MGGPLQAAPSVDKRGPPKPFRLLRLYQERIDGNRADAHARLLNLYEMTEYHLPPDWAHIMKQYPRTIGEGHHWLWYDLFDPDKPAPRNRSAEAIPEGAGTSLAKLLYEIGRTKSLPNLELMYQLSEVDVASGRRDVGRGDDPDLRSLVKEGLQAGPLRDGDT